MIDDDARRQEPATMSAVPDDTMQDNAALRDELSGMRRLHALQVSLAAQADARIVVDHSYRVSPHSAQSMAKSLSVAC
ncbi:hypothetical protein XarbCFBP8150_21290, partial [Xanthomonas arboricola]|uniref:hypothetical protein n=1 Tax=Xanthomonas arboricola TaxID=56448 RepID=UPI000D450DEE